MTDPREIFQRRCRENKWRWQDTVDHQSFQEAVIAALSAMQLNRTAAPDMGSAAARYWEMQGAKEFLNIFTTLLERERPQRIIDHNLNHNV